MITLLWHGDHPIGICVFCPPALSLAGRNRFFNLSGRWSRLSLKTLNRRLVCLSRVVLHPTYRGAGIGSQFIKQSCRLCPFDWIESLTELGQFHHCFEQAGFQRINTPHQSPRPLTKHSNLYHAPEKYKKQLLSPETHQKSTFSQPAYYILDNRRGADFQSANTHKLYP